MPAHVLPERVHHDGCRDQVCHEGHRDAHRDSAVGSRFGLDEVFHLMKNITQLTWPSRLAAGGLRVLLVVLLESCDKAFRNAEDLADVHLEDVVNIFPGEHSSDLFLSRRSPEVAHFDLFDEVNFLVFLWPFSALALIIASPRLIGGSNISSSSS